MHSDEFVQQRTSQFSTLNTILFAIAGIILNTVISEQTFSVLTGALFFISNLGLFASTVWFCSYKRSDLYRKIHRETLLQLDKLFLDAQTDLSLDNKQVLFGPFELRDRIAYQELPLNCKNGKQLRVNFASRKKYKFNVESIPLFSAAIWVLLLLLSIWLIVNSF